MLKSVVIILAFVGVALARPGEIRKVDSKLEQKLTKQNFANIFVNLAEGTAAVLKEISETQFASRDDKLIALQSALEVNSQSSQLNVTNLLDQSNSPFVILWITNQIYVRNASPDLVESISQLDEVSAIVEEQIVLFHYPHGNSPIINKRQDPTAEWGIQKIRADQAVQLLNATTTAANIIISTIDTGARVTHEALRDNYLGLYGWYDPYRKTELPNDQNGHGTHTTGTIAGKGGIGIYPNAKWTACKGCDTGSCAQSALIECGQFILCPTLADGSSKDCTKAPHLVSNSWEGGQDTDFYDGVVAAWHTAGIIPIFAIGNSGPSCGSVHSPGDRDVIAVGATTIDDDIAYFSSVGPTADGRMKPDVSAPGANILSAYNTADDAYRTLSGTSMACPHVAGLTAILLAFNPDLTYEQVQKSIFTGVDRNLTSANNECNGVSDDVFPNYHFGQGRVDALNSLTGLIQANKHL